MIKKVHAAGTPKMGLNEAEKTTMAETWIDVTYQNGQRHKMEEIAVQKWEGDKIIEEKFYYHMPPQG